MTIYFVGRYGYLPSLIDQIKWTNNWQKAWKGDDKNISYPEGERGLKFTL